SVRRKASRFEADDVGAIDAGQRLAAAGEIAGAKDLEVVRRSVPGEAEILLALADDLVNDGGGDAIGAETANGEIVPFADEFANCISDGVDFVGERPRLAGERLAQLRRRRVGEQLPSARRGSH